MTTQTITNTAAPAAKTFFGMTPAEWGDVLLVIAIIGIIAVAAYCGWQYWKKTKATKAAEVTETAPATATVAVDGWKVVSEKDDKYQKFHLVKGEKKLHVATFEWDTGKLYFIQHTSTISGSTTTQVEKPVVHVVIPGNHLGVIVVEKGQAVYKPDLEAE